jgi:hypothetical protein
MTNIKPLISAILIMIGFYLLFALVGCDLNVQNWSKNTRILYVWFGTIFSLIGYISIEIEQQNDKQ